MNCLAPGLSGDFEVPDARGVLAEDFRLDLGGQLWIAVAFDELVGDLELPKSVDLPLWVAPKAGIGSPHDVIRAEIAQQRPQRVRTLQWPARRRCRESRADLGVEVGALRLEAL